MYRPEGLLAFLQRIKSSNIVIYTETRFDDLFFAPTFTGAKSISVRLDLPGGHRGDENQLTSLTYWQNNDGSISSKKYEISNQEFCFDFDDSLNSLGHFDFIRFQYCGVPVGMHSWETVLRNDPASFSELLDSKVRQTLVDNINLSLSPDRDYLLNL